MWGMRSVLSRLLFLWGCYLLFAPGALSQVKSLPDSIYVRLRSIDKTGDQIKYLGNEIRKYAAQDSVYAFTVHHLMDSIAKASRDPAHIAKAKMDLGVVYALNNMAKEARAAYQAALLDYRVINDSLRIGYMLRNIGITHFMETEMDSAIHYNYESLGYLDPDVKDHRYMYALTCLELAKAFYSISNYKYSANYSLKAIPLFEDSDDKASLSASYNVLSLSMMEKSDTAGIQYLHKAYELSKELGDLCSQSTNLNNIAKLLHHQKRYKEALDTFMLVLHNLEGPNSCNMQSFIYCNIGGTYKELGRLDSAEYYLQKAVTLGYERGQFYAVEQSYHNLAAMRKTQGNYKEALRYYTMADSLKEARFTLKDQNLVHGLEKELALKTRKREIDLLSAQNDLAQKELYIKRQEALFLTVAVVGLIVVVMLLVFLYRRTRESGHLMARQKAEIEEQKQLVDQVNKYKDVLFSVVSHDLRGPVGNIHTLLSLLPSPQDKISENGMELLNLAKSSMSDLLQLLENLLSWAKTQRDGIALVKQDCNLNYLFQRVIRFNQAGIDLKSLQLDIGSDAGTKVKGDPATLELIVRNLLGNAIKYSSTYGRIGIHWHQDGQLVSIRIEDEAGGIPDSVMAYIDHSDNNGDTPSKISTRGLGLRLCKEFLEVNGGTWTFEKTSRGTVINILLPASASAA